MSEIFFNKLTNELPENTLITLCGIGEPTLHPQFLNFLKKLESKFNNFYLVTNGQNLNDESNICDN